jgi:hypothetical protein
MSTSDEVTTTVAVARSDWLAAFARGLRENSPLLALVALWLVVADGLSAALGLSHRTLDDAYWAYYGFLTICIACFAAAFCIWVLHVTLVRKISIQSRDFWRRIFGEFLTRERLFLSLPVLAAWPVMMQSFSLMKSLIPALHPFSLDTLFHEADQMLHFGHDPWALLQPLLGHPLITYTIDRLYALWLFVIYFSLLLQITSTRDKQLRLRFLLSNVVAWPLLGGVMATLLSSAGPCYFGGVVGSPDPYAPLMAYLHHTVQGTALPILGGNIELMALRVQALLWDYYQQGDFGLGRGISAAPSMHVASTWLVARMLQHYGRIPAILGWSFFGVILVGSVHLGWHYALDGYVAIIFAWIIWRAVGWVLDRPRAQSFLWPTETSPGR